MRISSSKTGFPNQLFPKSGAMLCTLVLIVLSLFLANSSSAQSQKHDNRIKRAYANTTQIQLKSLFTNDSIPSDAPAPFSPVFRSAVYCSFTQELTHYVNMNPLFRLFSLGILFSAARSEDIAWYFNGIRLHNVEYKKSLPKGGF